MEGGEGEGGRVDEGVDEAGEQGEAHRRGAPLAGTANSSKVETPSGSPAVTSKRPLSPKGDIDLPWVGARAGHL